MKLRRGRGIEHGFDHEDELVPGFPAVDNRWRVLGAWRDVAHLADERIAHAIDCDAHAVAVLDRANPRFRNEGSHLDVLGW